MNFIKRLKTAIFNIEKYQDFTQEKLSIAIKYFLKLILLLTVIIAFFFAYKFGNLASFFMDTVKSDFPEFTFSENVMSAEKVINVEKENKTEKIKLIVDTNIENETETINKYMTEISKFPNGAIFLKDRLIVGLEGLSGQITYDYKDLDLTKDKEINKEKLIESLDGINRISMYISIFIVVVLYMYVIYLFVTALDIAFVGIIGFVTTKLVRINIKIPLLCSMAIYSITLSVMLNAIYTPLKLLTGFNMEYFDLMYTLIPYVYMITAILMIRADLVKQQIEIGKIKKVQEEVKEEIEERKEKRERQGKREKRKERKRKRRARRL